MPASPHSELQELWRQCQTRRWRLPVWAQGDQAFLRSCWSWLQAQLRSQDQIFWLGERWPAAADTANIRQIDGQARQQLLGQECDYLVIQATEGMDWDLVAASMGCLKAGGIWLLLTPEPEVFIQQPNPAACRLLSFPTDATQHQGQFNRWLTMQWQQHAVVQWTPAGLKGTLPFTVESSNQPAPVGPYASHCQQQAVSAIHRVVSGHRNRPLVLSAHRGRGKSAALGIAAAQLQQAGKSRLIITAPQPAAALVALETCSLLLGTDTPSQLQFWPLDRLLAEQPAADLLLIDEAAAIPTPQLQALLQCYSRTVLATTEHGYEGTGRSFQLRFQQYLQQHKPGWRKLTMQQAIRYGDHDPLEHLLFQSFLLSDEDLPPFIESSEKWQYHSYTAADLVQQPALLRQIFRLAALAHYQTSVRDLWAMLDDPALLVVTLQQSNQVLALAVISKEGQLPAALVPEIYQGSRRVQGHLAAQSLVYHCLTPEAGLLPTWRVQRIMVQPVLQKQGLGRTLLDNIVKQAQSQQVAMLATSFGATAELVTFWHRAGFMAIKLSTKPEQSSNEYSVLMLRSLCSDLPFDVDALQDCFGQSLYVQARTIWSGLDPLLLWQWARPPQAKWRSQHQTELQLFMQGLRDWHQASATLKIWLDLNYRQLTAAEAKLWLPLCWQGIEMSLNNAQLKTMSLALRKTTALIDMQQMFRN